MDRKSSVHDRSLINHSKSASRATGKMKKGAISLRSKLLRHLEEHMVKKKEGKKDPRIARTFLCRMEDDRKKKSGGAAGLTPASEQLREERGKGRDRKLGRGST